MRRFLFHTAIILTAFLLTSCRPKGVLSTGEMTDVLFDIHLVEAMTYNPYGGINPSWTGGMSETDFTDLAYQAVLNKHGITEADFYASVGYYSKKMRLLKRIYLDLDDKMAAYVQSIDTWTESRKTEKTLKEMMKKDDKHIRALFEYMHVKPDTTTRKPFSFSPDSVKVMRWRHINRLMRRSLPIKSTYSMIGLKTLTDKQGNTLNDSTAKDVRAAIASGEIPTVDVLLKQALPMDELLRLRDAGAYDALMPKEEELENQPVEQQKQEERTKSLRKRTNRQ